jgi:hypothetical protein
MKPTTPAGAESTGAETVITALRSLAAENVPPFKGA